MLYGLCSASAVFLYGINKLHIGSYIDEATFHDVKGSFIFKILNAAIIAAERYRQARVSRY